MSVPTIITPPSGTVVTVPDTKVHLRVTHDVEDRHIVDLIEGATRYVEDFTHRCLLTTRIQTTFPRWPGTGCLVLPRSPLISVSAITYLDTGGVRQTLASSVYSEDNTTEPGEVFLAFGESWPAARTERGSIEVDYDAGYGNRDAVPKDLRLAVLWIVKHWYVERSAASVAPGTTAKAIPFQAHSVLWRYKVLS